MSKYAIQVEEPSLSKAMKHEPRQPLIERLKWKERERVEHKREWPGILNPSKGD